MTTYLRMSNISITFVQIKLIKHEFFVFKGNARKSNQIMCIIIIKQKGKQLPKEVAKTSARINPHGLGVIWLDTFEVTYHKSKDYKVIDTDRPFIAHFRYATIGEISRSNTHPFVCGANKQELLMMNGTIRGLGNAKTCDSKVLAIQLGGKPRHTWAHELSKYDCRFVTVNTRLRTFQIYNKDLWIQKDGIWYSKGNVLEHNLIAVYGTLKKGYSNYYHYLSSAKHVGSGVTKDKHSLVVAGLPYLIEGGGGGHNVEVDVFKVDDTLLKDLDKLEGHPNWYRRKQVPITIKGKTLMCWVYFITGMRVDGRVLHKSYVQQPRKIDYFTDSMASYWLEDEDDCEFSTDSETPVCAECYHDLVFDGFANYHCSGCGGWFTEKEIITFC